MKALTIHQPWASAIAHGFKRYETRSWPTSYRGPLAIHAGKVERFTLFRNSWSWICQEMRKRGAGDAAVAEFTERYEAMWPLPYGAVVAVAELVDCVPTGDLDLKELTAAEIALGYFGPGRFAWKLDVKRPLTDPIPARGRVGLWELDLDPVLDAGDVRMLRRGEPLP